MYIDSDTKIQVVETMHELSRAEKEQCGAFIVSMFLRLDDTLHNEPYSETNGRLWFGPTILKI